MWDRRHQVHSNQLREAPARGVGTVPTQDETRADSVDDSGGDVVMMEGGTRVTMTRLMCVTEPSWVGSPKKNFSQE